MSGAEPSDAELIRGSLQEPEAFRPFFERHYDAVRRYAQRALGSEAGEEIAAQTFLIAFERRARFDLSYRSARPWLYGIAHNMVRHQLRSEGLSSRAILKIPADPGPADVIDLERLEAVRVAPSLKSALRAIPEEQREAFLLVALGELTYEEVSRMLEIPIGTVRSRINRAKAKLRELIGPLEETPDEDPGRPADLHPDPPGEDTSDG